MNTYIEDILGITEESWNKKGYEFEVVLLKKNMLGNSKWGWWIDLQKTVTSLDVTIGHKPFANLKKILENIRKSVRLT